MNGRKRSHRFVVMTTVFVSILVSLLTVSNRLPRDADFSGQLVLRVILGLTIVFQSFAENDLIKHDIPSFCVFKTFVARVYHLRGELTTVYMLKPDAKINRRLEKNRKDGATMNQGASVFHCALCVMRIDFFAH